MTESNEKRMAPGMMSIQIARIEGRSVLHGEEFPQSGTVSIKISEAELYESSGSDHVFDRGRVMEIRMSERQYAHAITNMNRLPGGLCSVTYLKMPEWHQGGSIPLPKVADSEKVHRVASRAEQKARERAKEGRARVEAILARGVDKGRLGKRDLVELRDAVDFMGTSISRDVDFWGQVMREEADKVTDSMMSSVWSRLEYVMGALPPAQRKEIKDYFLEGSDETD